MFNAKKIAIPSDKSILTRKEAAYYLDLSPHYLRHLLLKGRGPRFMQPSGKWGKILFKIEWLDDWVNEESRKIKEETPDDCK